MNLFAVLAFALSLPGSAAGTPLAQSKLVRAVGFTHSFVGSILTQPRQYTVAVEIKKGDPYGSLGAGTIEVLTRPRLLLAEKQRGFFQVGQVADLVVQGVRLADSGLTLTVCVESTAENKVRVVGTAEATAVSKAGTRGATVRSERALYSHEAVLGETLRVRISKDGDQETWAELKVEAVSSVGPRVETTRAPTAVPAVPVVMPAGVPLERR